MRQIVFAVLTAFSLLALSGCYKAARYSHDEIKDYPPSVQEQIKKGEISVGMTKVQVRYAWGGPQDVIVMPPSDQGKERVEWVYRRYSLFKTRLIFVDGRLAEIASSEPGVVKEK